MQPVNKTKTNQMFTRITLPNTETWKHFPALPMRRTKSMPNRLPGPVLARDPADTAASIRSDVRPRSAEECSLSEAALRFRVT